MFTAPWFVLTPFGLTSLALLLLTAAFFVFLAQSRPRTAAGRWMLAHEASLGLFLLSNLLLSATFQTGWYPVEYLSFVVGMACLLQFAFAFPHPQPDARAARRLRAISSVAVAVQALLSLGFWLAPYTDRALLLRTVGTAMGLWQSLAALLVLGYRAVKLETGGDKTVSRWRAVLWPQRAEARAASAMFGSVLSIALLAAGMLIYRLWWWPHISEVFFNIAWTIGLMLMLSAFAIRYLIHTPEPISFRVKLTLGTLAAVLTSVWLLSLVYPFQLEATYEAERQVAVQIVQAELARAGTSAQPDGLAAALPDTVRLVAVCQPDASAQPQVLLARSDLVDLSEVCGPRFLINNTLSDTRLTTLMIIHRFTLADRTYVAGLAYVPYLALLDRFTLPIALVMLGSMVLITFLLPLILHRHLIRPLTQLLAGVQRVKQGDLALDLPVQSNDEIGQLAHTFQALAADLNASVLKLEEQVVAYRAAERALYEQREQLRALTQRLAEVEEVERQKLGRELHDQAGQNLTALSLTLKVVRTQLATGPTDAVTLEQLAVRLDDAAELVRQTTQRIRHVMDDLQPPALAEFGLAAALRWHAARFSALTTVTVNVQAAELARWPRPVEVALFRIAQEALNNVARHAQATHVAIAVCGDAANLRLSIVDDGVGFEHGQAARLGAADRSRWGLRIMAERAQAAGGSFQIESAPGRGTQIVVEVKA